jgi:hypothetical protein
LVCQRTASRARNSANRASDIFQKKSDQSSASQSLAIAAAKHSMNRLVGIQTKGGQTDPKDFGILFGGTALSAISIGVLETMSAEKSTLC